MRREAHGAAIRGQGTGHGLANPPGGIGGEAIAQAMVKPVDGVEEAQIALLDQVEERQATTRRVVARDTHHQPQIGLDHASARLVSTGNHLRRSLPRFGNYPASHELALDLFATGNRLRQRPLFVRCEQRDGADLVEVDGQAVIRCDHIWQSPYLEQRWAGPFYSYSPPARPADPAHRA